MAKSEGFREGCPAEVQLGEHPYIHTVVYFQADSKKLKAEDAGTTKPDAIRIVHVDDYMSSTYHDKVLAFNVDAAESQVAQADNRIPEKGIRLILDEQLERLNDDCESCRRAKGEPCPVLSAAIEEFESAPAPTTFKEAYIAELIWFLGEFGDSSASYFQVHRPAPPELSEEDLQDVVEVVAEWGWNASVEPLEHEGETVPGIKIVGGQSHEQPE